MRFQITTTSLSLLTLTMLLLGAILSLNYNQTLAQELDSSILSKIRIVDPKPTLIDNKTGSLINDISSVADITKTRTGTIADGISKLLLVVNYENPIKFSLLEDEDGQSSGTLSTLSSTETGPSYSVIIGPAENDTIVPLKVAVYTPPLTYSNSSANENHKTIKIFVQDAANPSINTTLPLSLYRVPVVLVHGIWSNSADSWTNTGFEQSLKDKNFDVYFAEYGKYNAATFDPFKNATKGNYGIDAIRNITKSALEKYEDKGIAASQVDIVAHSMGGLMARGFTQQSDYKNDDNNMKGYIHRLITIGTPHFGAQLAGILYDHRDDIYCYKWINYRLYVTSSENCIKTQALTLKDIYRNANVPIDDGGVEALKPNSTAYSNLNETKVSSYAIIGNWEPDARNSHKDLQEFYRNLTGDKNFSLEGKEAFGEDNDLQVNITSQSGGLLDYSKCDRKDSNIPTGSRIFNNTIHGSLLNSNATNVESELNSARIQEYVPLLLESPDDKYATSIGALGHICTVRN